MYKKSFHMSINAKDRKAADEGKLRLRLRHTLPAGLTQEEVARKMESQGTGPLLHNKRFMQNVMFRHGAG